MHIVYKATYHDLQASYNWKSHIIQNNKVVCGRELGIFWDQYSNEYPSLAELFTEHDPQGICWQCRHSSRLTPLAPDAGESTAPSELILASAKAASQKLSTPTQRG